MLTSVVPLWHRAQESTSAVPTESTSRSYNHDKYRLKTEARNEIRGRHFCAIHTNIHTYKHTCKHTCIHTYIHVANFVALAQASDFRIERRQVVLLCCMQDLNPEGLWNPISSRLNACWQTDWAIEDQANNLNSTARPYDQQAFSPPDPTAIWHSHLALAIYIFVVVNLDALAQASDFPIERRQVVFLCWMQANPLRTSRRNETAKPPRWRTIVPSSPIEWPSEHGTSHDTVTWNGRYFALIPPLALLVDSELQCCFSVASQWDINGAHRAHT